MMKRWMTPLAILLAAGLVLVGCAKDVEPQAKAETPKEAGESEKKPLGELKNLPADGDDVVVLETGKGQVVIMLYPDRAPITVDNFKNLAKEGFYNGTRFHRCIAGFMVQGGDPNSKDLTKSEVWGMGGNVVNGMEKNLPNEVNDIRHKRRILSMANSGSPETASSQFFIVQQDSAHLDGGYTAFGKVIKGMDIVDLIVTTGDAGDNGKVDPKNAVLLESAEVKTWPIEGVTVDADLAEAKVAKSE